MKRFLTFVAAALAAILCQAQDKRSSSFGLDPSDAAAVAYMRHRMDSIRAHRPTVALVLSGGGAKGAATVGALKYIERRDIPIDLIVGTSVGGLLGGFYSIGYSAGELDTLIRRLDWDAMLSDKLDPKYVPSKRRDYNERFALNFPFYYRAKDLSLSGNLPSPNANKSLKANFMRSLPSGVAYGTNVDHLIASRTVGYSDSTDFFKFPIPFACVATDVVSGRAKVWHSGSLNKALRSTMSIPGLFNPVSTDGMVLLDGGMRNNFPVEIARDLGADIVIGIDLRSDDSTAEVKNIYDIVLRSMDMFGQDSYNRSISELDLHIHPDLEGYDMLSFDQKSIEIMQERGYIAAKQKAAQLDSIKTVIGPQGRKAIENPALDILFTNVVIDTVRIEGLDPDEADYLRSRMKLKRGGVVNYAILKDDIDRIFGQGTYDFVNYELRGKEEPYELVLRCQKGPVHRFGTGIRFDTEDLVSLLVNVGFNTNSLQGSSFDISGKLGANPYGTLRYSLVRAGHAAFNVAASVRWTDRNRFISGDNFYNITFLKLSQEISVSDIRFIGNDISLGLVNDYWNVSQVLGSVYYDNLDPSERAGDYWGAFLQGRRESLDSRHFPTKGISAGFRAEFRGRYYQGVPYAFTILSADALVPATIGRFSVIPQGAVRFLIGQNIPLVYANAVGGDVAGRYIDHQIPFIGIDNAAFRRNCMIMGRLDLRYRFGYNHYAFVASNVLMDFERFADFAKGDLIWGVGAGYMYSTVAGPLKFQLHWSSLTGKVHPYFSFGYNF